MPPPKWSIFSRVECWDTNAPIRLKRAPEPWPIDDFVLQPGQIAIVLDLNGAAALPELLKLQWSSALYKIAASTSRLGKIEEERRSKASGTTAKAVPKRASLPHRDKRIDYLRIADAFSERFPATLEDVCETLYREGRLMTGAVNSTKNAEYSLTRAKNSVYKMIAASRSAIYEQGYLLLLAEEAAKANRQDQIAPYWPRSVSTQATLDNNIPWGADPGEPDLGPPHLFSGLGKRKKT